MLQPPLDIYSEIPEDDSSNGSLMVESGVHKTRISEELNSYFVAFIRVEWLKSFLVTV